MEESNLMNELSKERKSIKTDSYDMSVGEIISLYLDGMRTIKQILLNLY